MKPHNKIVTTIYTHSY